MCDFVTPHSDFEENQHQHDRFALKLREAEIEERHCKESVTLDELNSKMDETFKALSETGYESSGLAPEDAAASGFSALQEYSFGENGTRLDYEELRNREKDAWKQAAKKKHGSNSQ